MLLINCYVGQKVQSLLQRWWPHSWPCFQTADLNFTATFTSEGWLCILREIALHLLWSSLQCKEEMQHVYVSEYVYIYTSVITCRTPQPSNIQPCSSREGRALIHRFPLSLGTDLTHTIFGNTISTLERRGGKDMEISQVSVSFYFKR